MTDQPYTPDEEAASVAWIEYEASADNIDEAEAEFDRFIAQVKRDAATQALAKAEYGLSWFGAQGNTLDHMSAWQVVQACMSSIRAHVERIRQETP